MNQLIKKLLLFALFVQTANIYAQFEWVGPSGTASTPANGSDMNNWYDNTNTFANATATDFLTPGTTFDFKGAAYVDFGGLEIGTVQFTNSTQSTTTNVVLGFQSNKTLKLNYSSTNYPNFTLSGWLIGNINVDITSNTSSTLEFNYNGSISTQNILPLASFQNITFYGKTKLVTIAATINGTLQDGVSSASTLTFQACPTFGANSSIQLNANSTLNFTAVNGSNYFFTDSRTNKTYPGVFNFVNANGVINGGTFNKIKLSRNLSLDASTTTSLLDIGNYTLTVGSNTLTFTGTSTQPITQGTGTINPTNSTIKYAQTSTNGNNTLLLAAYSSNIYNLTLDFVNGGTLTPSGDMIIDNSLTMSTANNYFNINGTTLTVTGGVINNNGSSGGKFTGSDASNFHCQGTSTIYFDQRSESGRTLKNLKVQGNNVTVTLGNWLNITGGSSYGTVEIPAASSTLSTGGYLILKANSGGNAQIANSPGSITGNLHVQTYFPSTKGRAFRFLAPQVVGGNVLSWRDSGSTSSGTSTYGNGKSRVSNQGIQITGSGGSSNGFDESTTNKPSAFYFNESSAGNTGFGSGNDGGWVALTSGSQSIDNGKGYRVLVRGDRSIDLKGTTGSAANNVATTTQITGTYVGSSKTIRLYNSGSAGNNGINLIGNPYPATIDWQAVVSKNSATALDPTYVIYEPGAASYSAYSSTSNTGNATRYISSGQGFLVYTTTNNTDIVIDESCKNTGQKGDQFFKEQRTNHLVVKMNYDTLIYDKTFIYFLPGATNYYDKYDAGHIQNIAVNLASIDSTNTYYNINCLDSLVGSRIVPLTVEGTPAGSFELSFEDCGTFADHDIYLVDKYLKKTTKLDNWTTYTLDISSDPFSYENGRLNIVFEPKQNNAIVKLNKSDAFKLGPNPVKDYIRISNGKDIFNDFEYEISNINGQTIMKGSIVNSNDVINTSKIPTGIYFITVNTKTETQTIKFIK